MKPLLLLATIPILMASENGRAADARLEGCPAAAAIATSLAELRDANWQEVSLARVQALWRSQLYDLGCESEEGCILVGSKGRIIDGHCECCETFTFDVRENEDGSRREQLRGITIFYSSHRYKETVGVAKQLAKAAGLGGAQLLAVGNEPLQNFQWESTQRHELSFLELQLSRRGLVWTVRAHIGRHDISR